MLRTSFVPVSALLRAPQRYASLRCAARRRPLALRASLQGGGGVLNGAGGGGGGDESPGAAGAGLAFGASGGGGGGGNALVRVVSYNVLSSSLADPKHFKHNDPADLRADVRLARVLRKLEGAVAQRAVICLQEVSLAWAGPLHAFFAERAFHLVLGTYGSYFNGYMGVALAFPTDVFDADEVDVQCLANSTRWPQAPRPGAMEAFALGVRARLAGAVAFFTGERHAAKRRKSPWIASRDRRNVLIFARLRVRANGARLCVGTYHMPCAWWSPPIMLIHSALALATFQKLAGGQRAVLAGDFNIKPHDSAYRMITTGNIAPDHPDFPPTAPDGSPPDKWFPRNFKPMKSAYAEVNGEEPDFTNYARPGDMPTFIETLDYLFCSQHLDVVDVLPLPHRNKVNGPFPVPSEPSDHIMIGATVRLPAELGTPAKKNEAARYAP